ncbi:hypothetical protein LR48_Vigan10g073200 [Vigna angularis]|uniref:Uncharacterized protein n=1 Tax=Phaseolus angularis TaxID=3914 RepID=A0A0L9VIE3_PHAAN|nr:hypothetical protein LR48_Vigan10g073200 [Vigna angularis]
MERKVANIPSLAPQFEREMNNRDWGHLETYPSPANIDIIKEFYTNAKALGGEDEMSFSYVRESPSVDQTLTREGLLTNFDQRRTRPMGARHVSGSFLPKIRVQNWGKAFPLLPPACREEKRRSSRLWWRRDRGGCLRWLDLVLRMEKMKIVAALWCGSGKNSRLSVDDGDGDAIARRGRKRSWPAVRVAARREEIAGKKGCVISKEMNETPAMVVVVAAVDDEGDAADGDGGRGGCGSGGR